MWFHSQHSKRRHQSKIKWIKLQVEVWFNVHKTHHFMYEEDLEKMKLIEPGRQTLAVCETSKTKFWLTSGLKELGVLRRRGSESCIHGTLLQWHIAVSSITEVFTVQQLKEKRCSMAKDAAATTHYGLLDTILTSFNVDTDTADVVRRIW